MHYYKDNWWNLNIEVHKYSDASIHNSGLIFGAFNPVSVSSVTVTAYPTTWNFDYWKEGDVLHRYLDMIFFWLARFMMDL